jgi:hypothetical protein
MRRAITLLLQAGLLLSTIGAILFALQIIVGLTLGSRWFWGGAVAAFLGPVAFASTLFLVERWEASASGEAPK